MRSWNRERLLIVKCYIYLSGSSQKTETTKGLSNRVSLIEGTDDPNDGRAEKPARNEEATQRLARTRNSYFPWAQGITREDSFARIRSWGILWVLEPQEGLPMELR